MVKHGIGEEILEGFKTKTQFRSLVSNKVIKNGDRLRVTFYSGTGLIHKEGTASLEQPLDPETASDTFILLDHARLCELGSRYLDPGVRPRRCFHHPAWLHRSSRVHQHHEG